VRVLQGKVLVVLDPADQEEDYLRVNRSREKQYAFDTVFDTNCTTKQVFEATTQKLVRVLPRQARAASR
jgi:kinesin family protein 18/19